MHWLHGVRFRLSCWWLFDPFITQAQEKFHFAYPGCRSRYLFSFLCNVALDRALAFYCTPRNHAEILQYSCRTASSMNPTVSFSSTAKQRSRLYYYSVRFGKWCLLDASLPGSENEIIRFIVPWISVKFSIFHFTFAALLQIFPAILLFFFLGWILPGRT